MDYCYVIAEAGVNHNGCSKLAIELIDIAASVGADAIKFQSFTADELVSEGTEKAEYQRKDSELGDQHSMLKNLEMSSDLHLSLIEHCDLRGIEFMSTAFDKETLDFLIHHGMKRIKIPSGELTNHPFIKYIASKNMPIIMSTGMASMDEIRETQVIIEIERNRLGFEGSVDGILTILQCTSNYPTHPEDVNLRAMRAISDITGMPIGYSDHTLGTVISTAAVALGAVIIEKHFTKSRKLPGPDHAASLEPHELCELISNVRTVSMALGSATKRPTDNELPVRQLVRRSITLNRDVMSGHILGEADITLKRPGSGIEPKHLSEVTGRKVLRDLVRGHTLNWTDLK